MTQISQILLLFKEGRQTNAIKINQKVQRIQMQRKELVSAMKMDKILQTQKSVEERMGPLLCVKSKQNAMNQKTHLLSTLHDYQKSWNKVFQKEESIIKQSLEQFGAIIDDFSKKVEENIEKRQKQLQSTQKGIINLHKQNQTALYESFCFETQITKLNEFTNLAQTEIIEQQLKQKADSDKILNVIYSIHSRK